MWWSVFYAVNSVCWGDSTYLDVQAPLSISFGQFIQLYFWSIWQLSTGVIVIFPYAIWAIFGIFMLASLLWYEVAFNSVIPFSQIENDNKPLIPVEDEEWI